jgi:hypothetical protein
MVQIRLVVNKRPVLCPSILIIAIERFWIPHESNSETVLGIKHFEVRLLDPIKQRINAKSKSDQATASEHKLVLLTVSYFVTPTNEPLTCLKMETTSRC